MLSSSIDPLKHPRTFYIYTPAQRRVRLAPDLAYDYPLTSLGGAFNFDDWQLFSGTMDRLCIPCALVVVRMNERPKPGIEIQHGNQSPFQQGAMHWKHASRLYAAPAHFS